MRPKLNPKSLCFFSNLLFGFLLICSFYSCKITSLNNVDFSNSIARTWMLVSFQNFPKEFLIEKRAQIDLSKKNENHLFWAFMGCNSYSFSARHIDKERIDLSIIEETHFNCSLLNYEGSYLQFEKKLETEFKTWFPQMTKYKIQGHFLTLSDGKGNEMKFIAADWD